MERLNANQCRQCRRLFFSFPPSLSLALAISRSAYLNSRLSDLGLNGDGRCGCGGDSNNRSSSNNLPIKKVSRRASKG